MDKQINHRVVKTELKKENDAYMKALFSAPGPSRSLSKKRLARHQSFCLVLVCLFTLFPLWGCRSQKKEQEAGAQANLANENSSSPAAQGTDAPSTQAVLPMIAPENLDPDYDPHLLDGRITAEPTKPLDEDQTLRLVTESMPSKLDPWTNLSSYNASILQYLYDPLVGILEDGDGQIHYYGAACQKIQRTKDQLTYIFYLRPDAVWSDGEKVTAQHFVDGFRHLFSLPKEVRPGSYMELLQDIENASDIMQGTKSADELGVLAVNPGVLMIKLSHPSPEFLALSSLPCVAPYRKDKMDAWGDKLGTSPETLLTNGPYVVSSWTEDKVQLAKNPNYHAADEYYLTSLEYLLLGTAADWSTFLKGDIDLFDHEIPDWKAMLRRNPHLVKRHVKSPSLSFLLCQTQEAPLNHPKLRQALSQCLDREEISNKFWDDSYMPATGYLPHRIFVDETEYRSKAPSYFTDAPATTPKELFLEGMKEVGLGDDPSSITLEFVTVEGDWYKAFASYLAKCFEEKLGIKLIHKPLPWEQLQKALEEGKYQLALMGWTSETRDPSALLTLMTTEGNKTLGLHWSNPKYDSLVAGALHNPDPAVRLQNYQEAEELLISEMPVIPFVFWRDAVYEMDYLQGTTQDKVNLISVRGRYISGREANRAETAKIWEELQRKDGN